MHFKQYPKGTDKWDMHKEILEAMETDFYKKRAKEAVIKKYLKLCKNHFIDDVMAWRQRYLACRFDRGENCLVKVAL